MGSFIARQPNGLICRFSSVVDTVTEYNMTDEQYIEACVERAREDAKFTLEHYMRPYEWVKDQFLPANMTREEFDEVCKEMENPIQFYVMKDGRTVSDFDNYLDAKTMAEDIDGDIAFVL